MSDAKKGLFTSPAELMRAIGSKEGFDPMPPSQHRAFMDRKHAPKVRVMGLLFNCTIHPGKGRRRSSFARDPRTGRAMRQKDFCDVLGISDRNMTTYFAELAEEGKLWIDDERRIHLGGNAEEPEMEPGDHGENKANKETGLFSTKEFPKYIAVFLQQLSEIEPKKGAAAAKVLGPLAPEFKQWEADAMAQVREKQRERIASVLAPFGFQDGPSTGRPRVSRKEFTVRVTLYDSSAQKSEPGFVQNDENSSVQQVSSSVREGASLLPSETEFFRVSGANPPAEIAETEVKKEAATPRPGSSPTPPTTPLTKDPGTEREKQAEAQTASPVVEAFELRFRRTISSKDPLRAQIAALAEEHGLPERSVVKWVNDKCDYKDATRKPITSPGALYKWAVSELPGWIRDHGREIEADRKWEAAEAREAAERAAQATKPPPKPFDPMTFNAEVELTKLAVKKGMP